MLPLGKTLDVGIANNWELAWAGIKVATEENKRNYRFNRKLLDPFDIPIIIDSLVVAIKCSLANCPPTWQTSGTLLRIVDFPKDSLTIEDEFPGIPTAVLDKRYLRLNSDFEILIFNQSSETLKLSFIPRPWLPSIGMVVYKYTGTIGDDTLNQIEAMRISVEYIKDRVG